MNALKEIREVVDETTEKLIELQLWHFCRSNGKTLRQMEIILQKAAAFDKISRIMEKEEADWWEK